MLFNSFEFLIFFPCVTLLYFLLPQQWRVKWLLAASCVFYMAFVPYYILILGTTILVDYLAAIWIEDSSSDFYRRIYLGISIVATCLILFVFKYFNFFNESAAWLAGVCGIPYAIPALKLILPIGLSFHTFQSLSYVIEVARGEQRAERDFWVYSLYVMFYPQLVAGPIERPQNLLHQFHTKHDFDAGRIASGLKLMMWGLFKKVVIADRLSPLVDHVYSQPQGAEGWPTIIATVFFAFQIYCDFSGYSDMAIGSAQVMGFRLMTNFDRPYFSTSVSEFWRRWHISLSTWFKDYLYVPFGGSRHGRLRTALNLMITFVISGLWHGANWTFVIWGALNGLFLIGEMTSRALIPSLPSRLVSSRLLAAAGTACTFALICLSWIFFRAGSVDDALYMVRHLGDGLMSPLSSLSADWTGQTTIASTYDFGVTLINLWLSFGLIVVLLVAESQAEPGRLRSLLVGNPWWVRWPAYYALVYGILFLGVFQKTQFIYFQF